MAISNEHVCPLELRRSCRFRRGLFPIAFVEAIDASRSINQLLFAGEKRVASRADFNVQIALFG